jgi:thiamine-phosphate pyrophosphorylase
VSEFQPTRLETPESGGALRRERLGWARVYFVCDAWPHGADPEPLLRAALTGGVGMVELRERERPRNLIDRAAETYRRLCDTYSAPFIVNDDPRLALELKADGVHVGQEDASPQKARDTLGEEAIVGLSTHSGEQIEAANRAGVDYISVGPVWETPTKAGRPATGLDLIRTAAKAAQVPWFAIGGITPDNVGEVLDAGAERVCVVRAIRDAGDPTRAASELSAAIDAQLRSRG